MIKRHLSLWVTLILVVLAAMPNAGVQAQGVPRTLKFAIGIDIDTNDSGWLIL